MSDRDFLKGVKMYAELKQKVCSNCDVAKEEKEFSARNARKSGKASWCKSCLNEWRRQDKINNPDKYQKYEFGRGLKRNYGISVEQYNKMLQEQNECCACCGNHQSEFKRRLHVDHDHATGQVRALLCTLCNPLVGFAKECTDRLEMAVKYLKKFKK